MAMRAPETDSKILLIGKEDSWIPINRRIARVLGKKAAEFIQNLHYWLTTKAGAIVKGVHWVYNTYEEWSKQLGIPKSTIRAIIYALEKEGIIVSGNFNKKKSDRTKWYTIAYDVLKKLIGHEEGLDKQPEKDPVDNLSSPCARSEHITTNRLTSNTSLNSACAPETFQPLVVLEEIQSGVFIPSVKEEIAEANTFPLDLVPNGLGEDPVSSDSLEDEALLILKEAILSKLDTPIEIFKPLFKNTISKRMRTHFGLGKQGLERFRDYCTKYASNLFLMGKKAMKSGDTFVPSVGTIMAEKMIEASWEDTGFFNIYPPKKTPEKPREGARESKPGGGEVDALPVLSLEEVLETATTETDKRVKEILYQTLGEVTYQAWFYNTGFVAKGLLNGESDFSINTPFARDYVLTHYGDCLRKAFEEGPMNRVSF